MVQVKVSSPAPRNLAMIRLSLANGHMNTAMSLQVLTGKEGSRAHRADKGSLATMGRGFMLDQLPLVAKSFATETPVPAVTCSSRVEKTLSQSQFQGKSEFSLVLVEFNDTFNTIKVI